MSLEVMVRIQIETQKNLVLRSYSISFCCTQLVLFIPGGLESKCCTVQYQQDTLISVVALFAAVVGLSPEGRGEKEAHVAISNEFLASIPALTGEDTFILKELAPEHSAK